MQWRWATTEYADCDNVRGGGNRTILSQAFRITNHSSALRTACLRWTKIHFYILRNHHWLLCSSGCGLIHRRAYRSLPVATHTHTHTELRSSRATEQSSAFRRALVGSIQLKDNNMHSILIGFPFYCPFIICPLN